MRIGGMEKALVELLNELEQRGYDITLVLEHKRGELLGQLGAGIRVQEYRVSSNRFVPYRKAVNLLHRIMWRLQHGGKYDFSCAYATYSVIGSRLALAASQHSSLYVHSNYYDLCRGDKEAIRLFFDELSIHRFRHIVFVSEEGRKSLIPIYSFLRQRGRVINNLMDADRVERLSHCNINLEYEQEDGHRFLFVGRLENESKCLTRLIRSFALACRKEEGIRLYIIGDGKDRGMCERAIHENGMDDRIRMLGKKENPYPYMRAADCVLLTSDYEGYPVIYNECLILQKPLITTVPVSDGQIDISDYALITDKSEQAVSEAILYATSNMEEMRERARKNAVDFRLINEKRIHQIEDLIEER